jgi:phage terminase small subunit
MKGRKVIPIPIKKAKGTYQKCRDKGSIEPSSKKPHPPSWLTPRAKQIFHQITKRLEDTGRASATFTEVQALLASRLEEVERFDKMLNGEISIEFEKGEGEEKEAKKINGYVYVTTNSFGDPILKDNPAVAQRKEAMRHAHSLLAELGLTHVSAEKFGSRGNKPKKNDFEGF